MSDADPDLPAPADAEPSIGWGRRVLGHLGVCFVEAGLAAALLAVVLLVAAPLLLGAEGGAEMGCAYFVLMLWTPVAFLGWVVVFVLAKGLVELLPARRRHLALAVYWALGIGVAAWLVGDAASDPSWSADGSDVRFAVVLGLLIAVGPVVLTITHFTLLPRVSRGASARDALRAWLRRSPPEG